MTTKITVDNYELIKDVYKSDNLKRIKIKHIIQPQNAFPLKITIVEHINYNDCSEKIITLCVNNINESSHSIEISYADDIDKTLKDLKTEMDKIIIVSHSDQIDLNVLTAIKKALKDELNAL